MSYKSVKRDVKAHSQELSRQKINSVYGTMRSVTTNGTLVRPVNDPFTSTTSNTNSQARWT